MNYIVLCNDHIAVQLHMKRFRDEHPDCTLNIKNRTITFAGDTYIYFAKTEDANQLLGYVFDALMIPPGYQWYNNAEVMAMSRVRFRNATHPERTS